AVLDIVPTRTIYHATNRGIATDYYHWFFLIQPFDLPERLIGADPDYFITRTLQGWGSRRDVYAPEAMAEYVRCFRDPAAIHAACEDYRAAASIDLAHDEADIDSRIEVPLLASGGGAASWRSTSTSSRPGASAPPTSAARHSIAGISCRKRYRQKLQ